jgi:hypothetical protein
VCICMNVFVLFLMTMLISFFFYEAAELVAACLAA